MSEYEEEATTKERAESGLLETYVRAVISTENECEKSVNGVMRSISHVRTPRT